MHLRLFYSIKIYLLTYIQLRGKVQVWVSID